MNDVFVSIWIILWFITLMTSSFSQRTWRTMNTHVCLVLEKLREVGLYAKLEKCEFHQSKVEFLGYTISRNDICMDPRKVQTIVDCVTLISIRNVQCFLGFVNFYWHFITHYSSMVALLFSWIRKIIFFSWGVEVNNAFQYLKFFFTTTSLLIHVEPSKPFVLETNIFDFVVGAVLSQLGKRIFFVLISFLV